MKYQSLLFIIFLCISCSHKGEVMPGPDLNRIIVDELPQNTFSFFDVIEEYQFIKLETVENALIGRIHKVILVNERIYILDLMSAKGIYSFDIEGRFISKIGNYGRGPGEWIAPQDIAFHTDNQTLIVYCSNTRKLIFYSIDGDFIEEIHLGLTFKSMEYINQDTIIAFSHGVYNHLQDYGELPFDLIAFDTKIQIKHTQFLNHTEAGIGKTVMTMNNYFTKSDSGIFLNWFFNDTIYFIENHCLYAKPFLYLDFGKKRFTKHELSNLSGLEIMERISEDRNRAIIRPVHVSDDLILIEFAAGIAKENPDDNYRILFNLKTGEKLKFKDLVYCNSFKWKTPIGVSNDFFVNTIYPYEITCIENDIEGISLNYDDLEDGNLIILLYRFKDINDWN